jgi:hypothetical protein
VGDWSSKPQQTCTDPATCFDDTGAVDFSDCIVRRCSVEFEAAAISLHAPQRFDSFGRMPRAIQGARISRTLVDNRTTVEEGDLTYTTLLLVAGKQWIEIHDSIFMRDESVRPGKGVTVRPLIQLGDKYHPGTDYGLDYAPAVDPGGVISVARCVFWSAEGGQIKIDTAPGSRLEWSDCILLPGSAPVNVTLNGQSLGSITGNYSLEIE